MGLKREAQKLRNLFIERTKSEDHQREKEISAYLPFFK